MKIHHFLLVAVITLVVDITAGEIKKDLRLIGASPASPGEFKWIVSLQRDKHSNGTFKHFCAGSIVDSTHIVTAAHCVWDKKPGNLTVIAGALNITANEESQQRVNISNIILHPDYVSQEKAGPNDIAILELETPLVFDNNIGPIALPDQSATGICKFTGWGNQFMLSGMYYKGSDVLLKVSSYVLPKFACYASYLFVFRRQLETALCTAAGPLRGSCQGDSGGPATCYKEDGTPYLGGIVSWGFVLCGDGLHPDVSTDVALFTDFIKQHLTPTK